MKMLSDQPLNVLPPASGLPSPVPDVCHNRDHLQA
jgi:hypothetical protein